MYMEYRTIKNDIFYFKMPGRENTEKVLELVQQRAKELNINTIVVASTSGETGKKAVDYFKGLNVVVVTHVYGFKEPNMQEMRADYIDFIITNGGKIVTAAHAFSGVARAIRSKFSTYETTEIIAGTLRIFCQGMKVACEIAMMAADAGAITTDRDIICIAGTARGADTAVVIRPVNSHNFFDMKIREIICMPR